MAQEHLIARVGADLTGFNQGMSRAGSTAQRISGNLIRWAKRAAIAIAGIGTAAAIVGSKFEFELTKTATVARAFGADLDALRDKARELGSTTAFTATQAATGMYDLASAGMKTNQILAATEHAMKLAGATGSEMAQATGLIAASLKQFNLEAAESKRVVDTYAGAITGSLLTMEKLTQAMKFAGTTGAALKWSIEETTAAVAQFANLGLEGSMAGTNLRMSMIQLVKQVPKATAALKEMGLTFEDVNPETHNFGEILQTVGDRAITTAQAVAIFGTRSALNMKQLATLAREGKIDFEGFTQSLIEAQEGAGRATEMYNRMMDTFRGQLKILISALQDLAIEVFYTFDTAGKDIFNTLTKVVNDIKAWVKGNRDIIIDLVEGIETALNAVIDSTKILWTVMSAVPAGFIDFFTKAEEKVRDARGEVEGLTGAIETQKTTWEKLVIFMTTWGNAIVDTFKFMLKSVGVLFALLVGDIVAGVVVIAKEMWHLAAIIGNALIGRFDKVKEEWGKLVKSTEFFTKQVGENWEEATERIREYAIELLRATGQIPPAAPAPVRGRIGPQPTGAPGSTLGPGAPVARPLIRPTPGEIAQAYQDQIRANERRLEATQEIEDKILALTGDAMAVRLRAARREYERYEELAGESAEFRLQMEDLFTLQIIAAERERAEEIRRINRETWQQRVSAAQQGAGQLSRTAELLYSSGIARSRKMWRVMKALRIGETIVNTAAAIMQALASWPPPISYILAATSATLGAVQIAAIMAQRFPAAQHGGVIKGSQQGQLVQVGERGTDEAIIPLRGGAVPVTFTEAEGSSRATTINHIDMRGSTFLDQATLRRTMGTIAVSAVVQDYRNDGPTRTLMKRGM